MKKKKNSFRKRYFLLLILALLPFYKFYHEKDYCFGDTDLVIIGGYAVLFFMAFLVVLFYNLYKISLKIELLNYRPILILALFLVGLSLAFKYHDQSLFKTKKDVFLSTNSLKKTELILFNDATFQLKKSFPKKDCYFKGIYSKNKDTIYLNKYSNSEKSLENSYFFDKKNQVLRSTTTFDSKFKKAD